MAKTQTSFSKERLLVVLSALSLSACDRSTAPKPEGADVHEEALKANADEGAKPADDASDDSKGAIKAQEVGASAAGPKEAQKGKAGSEGKCGEGRCGEGKCG